MFSTLSVVFRCSSLAPTASSYSSASLYSPLPTPTSPSCSRERRSPAGSCKLQDGDAAVATLRLLHCEKCSLLYLQTQIPLLCSNKPNIPYRFSQCLGCCPGDFASIYFRIKLGYSSAPSRLPWPALFDLVVGAVMKSN